VIIDLKGTKPDLKGTFRAVIGRPKEPSLVLMHNYEAASAISLSS
jgi:hypothetical protein